MSILTLYHGSPNIIECPAYGKGKSYSDYGCGFYCTEHIELAKEWACAEGVDGYANHYEIEMDGLRILNLSSDEYGILNWLALLIAHRHIRVSTPVSQSAKAYLLQNFLPDFEEYDTIIGYRADDSYFSFARAFLSNTISLKQLSYAMRLGKLGEQFVLKSERAFKAIKFVDYTRADNAVYYAKRKTRDDEAKVAFMRELANEDLSGIYMRDIIREEMKQYDPRLR